MKLTHVLLGALVLTQVPAFLSALSPSMDNLGRMYEEHKAEQELLAKARAFKDTYCSSNWRISRWNKAQAETGGKAGGLGEPQWSKEHCLRNYDPAAVAKEIKFN